MCNDIKKMNDIPEYIPIDIILHIISKIYNITINILEPNCSIIEYNDNDSNVENCNINLYRYSKGKYFLLKKTDQIFKKFRILIEKSVVK